MQVIYNSLKSSDLDVVALSDPTRVDNVVATSITASSSAPVDVLAHQLADQINQQRMSYSPPFRAINLEEMIHDIIVETSAQGASLLEVHVIDPFWVLFRRDTQTQTSFIDTDQDGYIWPPIEVNFPENVSDAVWRLCQVKPTTDLANDANVVLVFEDKIVAEMREHDSGGLNPTDPSLGSSNPNETRAEFIKRCVSTVSKNPLLPQEAGIRFISLLPHSDFTTADLVGSEVTLPASAVQPFASPSRANPTKAPGGTTNKTTPKGATTGAVKTIDLALGLVDGVDLDGVVGQTLVPPAPLNGRRQLGASLPSALS